MQIPLNAFGLHNAAQTFQRFIDQVLRDFHFCYIYIDDVLPVPMLMNINATYNWYLTTSKNMESLSIQFGVEELDFLGHKVNSQGICPLPDKVQAIQDFPQPQSQRQLRDFISLINFYHRFIPNVAQLLQPLHNLLAITKNKMDLQWTEQTIASFVAVKQALIQGNAFSAP